MSDDTLILTVGFMPKTNLSTFVRVILFIFFLVLFKTQIYDPSAYTIYLLNSIRLLIKGRCTENEKVSSTINYCRYGKTKLMSNRNTSSVKLEAHI